MNEKRKRFNADDLAELQKLKDIAVAKQKYSIAQMVVYLQKEIQRSISQDFSEDTLKTITPEP